MFFIKVFIHYFFMKGMLINTKNAFLLKKMRSDQVFQCILVFFFFFEKELQNQFLFCNNGTSQFFPLSWMSVISFGSCESEILSPSIRFIFSDVSLFDYKKNSWNNFFSIFVFLEIKNRYYAYYYFLIFLFL